MSPASAMKSKIFVTLTHCDTDLAHFPVTPTHCGSSPFTLNKTHENTPNISSYRKQNLHKGEGTQFFYYYFAAHDDGGSHPSLSGTPELYFIDIF